MVLLPEARCEPLALALGVVEASSLLLSPLVALAEGAAVREGWLLDRSSEAEAEAESGGLGQRCMLDAVSCRRTVVLAGENVPDVPEAVDVGKGVRHGSRDRSHGQKAGEEL